MASVAKHIQTARTEGVEAGFEQYIDTPASKIHPQYKRIVGNGRRSHQRMIDAYCTEFATQLGQRPARTPVVQEKYEGDVQTLAESIQEQVAGMVASMVNAALQGNGEAVVEDDQDAEPMDNGIDEDALVELVAEEFDLTEAQARRNIRLKAAPVMRFIDEINEDLVSDNTGHSVRASAPAAPSPAQATTRKSRKAPTGAVTAGDAWEALGGGETFRPNDPDKEANNGQLYRLNIQGKLALVS